MAGTRWTICVVVLALFAWQVRSAEELVNLLDHKWDLGGPSILHDGDTSTYLNFESLKEYYDYLYPIYPTVVRIHMAAHVTEEEYPRRWILWRGAIKVTNAKFKNGVFDVAVPNPGYTIRSFRMRFWKSRRTYSIGEIEFLGPQSSLDKTWPTGKYPCSQLLEDINYSDGPRGKVFYSAKNEVKPKELRALFSNPATGNTFEWEGRNNPVIIGAELPADGLVHQVRIDGWRLATLYRVAQIVLEANMCEPKCNRLGSKGWVRLAEFNTHTPWGRKDQYAPRLFVETPDTYRAYRLKFVPITRNNGKPKRSGFSISGIHFYGCKA